MGISRTLQLIQRCFRNLLLQYQKMREYRAIIHFCQVLEEIFKVSVPEGGALDPDVRRDFASEHAKAYVLVGNFGAAWKVALNGATRATLLQIPRKGVSGLERRGRQRRGSPGRQMCICRSTEIIVKRTNN